MSIDGSVDVYCEMEGANAAAILLRLKVATMIIQLMTERRISCADLACDSGIAEEIIRRIINGQHEALMVHEITHIFGVLSSTVSFTAARTKEAAAVKAGVDDA